MKGEKSLPKRQKIETQNGTVAALPTKETPSTVTAASTPQKGKAKKAKGGSKGSKGKKTNNKKKEKDESAGWEDLASALEEGIEAEIVEEIEEEEELDSGGTKSDPRGRTPGSNPPPLVAASPPATGKGLSSINVPGIAIENVVRSPLSESSSEDDSSSESESDSESDSESELSSASTSPSSSDSESDSESD